MDINKQIEQECRFLEAITKVILQYYDIGEIDSLLLGLDLLDQLEKIRLR